MAELQRGRAFGRERDREMERRAVTDGAFHPDLASVHLHDLLNDREAEASPGYRLRGAAAHSPEALEDVADLVRRDAETGVRDADQRVTALDAAGQRDRAAFGRVLDRVVDQVAHDLDQPVADARHDGQPSAPVRPQPYRDNGRRGPR